MPYCTYCGQAFTRDEHLERHILTHTNVKPYKCFNCHMSFARRDLLHRHYTVHGRDANQEPLQPSNGIVPKSAGRTPIACSNCAKTKTKCDKKFPCTRCATRNLKCTVRPTRRTTKNTTRIMEEATALQGTSEPQDRGDQDSSVNSQRGTSADSPSPAGGSSKLAPKSEAFAKSHPAPPMLAPKDNSNSSSGAALSAQAEASSSSSSSSSNGTASSSATSVDDSRRQMTINTNLSDGKQGPSIMTQTQLSPVPTPVSGFFQPTPLSVYDEFGRPNDLSADGTDRTSASSPKFMMDWPQTTFNAYTFDQLPRQDLMMSNQTPFDSMPLTALPSTEPLNVHSPFATALPWRHSMAPPASNHGFIQSVPLEQPMSSFRSSRQSSTAGSASSDLEAVTIAQDAWSSYRCTPCLPANACPKTARLNLERLEQSLQSHETWSNWSPTWDEGDVGIGEHLSVVSLNETPREKLLAITQGFLHKALEIHKDDVGLKSPDADYAFGSTSNFVILPPARVLEYFLRSYANSFERFYPVTPKGALDANELMSGPNERASSLLLLLMIGHGALITPTVDGRWLTGGLTEACRISLFDLIEKNILLVGDPLVLHSALLFTAQAAWSGDKWQMDIAMGQRGMYFTMLRHSGHLGASVTPAQTLHQRPNIDFLWREWMLQESRSRLVYSWVMIDQDLSLFNDQAPLLCITELSVPMPDADALWQAKTAQDWSQLFEQVHEFSGGYSSVGSGARPLCLRELFRLFLDDALLPQRMELTVIHLRLLLHPIQAQLCQMRQLLGCFSDAGGLAAGAQSSAAASALQRMEEIKALLQRWHILAEAYLKTNSCCPMMQATLVVFHLLSLNARVSFQDVERVARRDGIDGSYQQLIWLHRQCIACPEEVVFHGGQVLRLIRLMPRSIRPPWWAGAVYRVALVFWFDSLLHDETMTPTSGLFPTTDSTLAVDNLPPADRALMRYLTKREGKPMLTKRDGSLMSIDNPFAVLFHCVDVISEGVQTRFTDGLCHKLAKLAKG